MADHRNATFKPPRNPLLTGVSLDNPFENISNSALILPQPLQDATSVTPLPNDAEVDSFLGQDTHQIPSSFSSIINQGLPDKSQQDSKNLVAGDTTVPSSYLPSQSINYYTPLISTPICTPIVTSYQSSVPQNTLTNASYNYSTPITDSTFQHSQVSVESNSNNHIDVKTSASNNNISILSPFNLFSSKSSASTSSSFDQNLESKAIPVSNYPLQAAHQGNSAFQPVIPGSQGKPTSNINTIASSSIFQPIANPQELNSNQFVPPPISFYNPSSLPSANINLVNTNTLPTQPPSFLTPICSANDQVISSFNNLLINPVQSSSPSIFTPTTSSTVPLIATYSNPHQSGNGTIVSQFSLPSATEAPNVISTPPPSIPTIPPTGGNAPNTYRLGKFKRPAYAPPPDLNISATNMAAVPGPVAVSAAPNPATLFNPASTDLPDYGSLSSKSQASLVTNTSNVLPQSFASNSATTDLSTNPTLPSYQSPVSAQTPPATVIPPSESNFPSLPQGGPMYRPPYHHWFFKKQIEGKALWYPFSMPDSLKLEEAFTSPNISPNTLVPTDGGRYDVDVLRRQRTAVYWTEDPSEVRRCSWFYKGTGDVRYIPYEEKIATLLEEEFKIACTTNEWNRKIPLPEGEVIILHSASAIAHHLSSSSPDAWGNPPQMQQIPRLVKRGLDEFNISEGEPDTVDHLLFLVHGIGKFCDLKFRPVTEVVDDFRTASYMLLQSHFRSASEIGTVNRVEVLPISWHAALHTEDIDRKLRNITLGSIHRLRQFTNDTLLDILFYTSPVFCETIVQAVGNELNRLYSLFKTRNPQFNGFVSLGGHSLGSLILFDMLCNQKAEIIKNTSLSPSGDENRDDINRDEMVELKTGSSDIGDMNNTGVSDIGDQNISVQNRKLSYVSLSNDGTGQPSISYPQLDFHPKNFFALGSPIGMFVTIRGIDSLGDNFRLPTCPAFFNIFHPFDPVAYRVEALISPELINIPPVLIPHHKGRKRLHYELKETMSHFGAAIKQRLVESFQATWNTVYQMAMFHKTDNIGEEVNKVIEDQIMRQQSSDNLTMDQENIQDSNLELKVGTLNGGRRIDYVLQEAPLESFNEYLFAFSSHVCYWESEDTMLMILKEIYGTMGIMPDNQVTHQILPFEVGDRTDGQSYDHPQFVPLTASAQAIGMDPTAPPSDNIIVGPPPMSGFRRN